MAFDTPPEGLPILQARLRRDLELLGYPPEQWVSPAGGTADNDVVVVGGGMCGLCAGFALLRAGVTRLQILDARPAGQEGPWVTYARMQTLRSPKHLTGPAMGLASLTFRAWFEAQWGASAWSQLGRIARSQWMDYLCWYRRVLELPVQNETRVVRIEPRDGNQGETGFRLHIRDNAGESVVGTRKLVLAMGRESLARARIPDAFRPHLGPRCQHTSEDIDFDAMGGKRVAVIGVAASALDNAAVALEHGAAAVHVLGRSKLMPRVNKAKGIVYAGFTEGFPDLADADKLALLDYIARCGLPAPRDTVLRVARQRGFHLHMATEIESVTSTPQGFALLAGQRQFLVDHIILGTGFRMDVLAAPELQGIASRIARWSDRLRPDPELMHSEYLDFPYLGPGFEFQERDAGGAPYLRDLYCFSHAAALSHGNVSSDIPSVSDGAQRLARSIARDFFVADLPAYRQRLHDFDDPELLGDELDLQHWWPPR